MEPLPRCRRCKRILEKVKWNTKGDVLVCDNPECVMYCQPQEFIEQSSVDMNKVLNRRTIRKVV